MRIMLVMALAVVGCSAPVNQGPASPKTAASNKPTPAPQQGDQVECVDEAPTGSLLRHQVCRDNFEREGNRQNAERWAKTPRAAPVRGN